MSHFLSTFFCEKSKNAISIVARGPVPRDRPSCAKNGRSPELTAIFFHDRCMARDRPSPYGNGDGFLFLTVARGPVPRDRCMAEDRPPRPTFRVGKTGTYLRLGDLKLQRERGAMQMEKN